MLTPINGVPYFWRDVGQGPLLLLLHGGMAHSGWFRWVIPRLARTYRVLTPDLRGHGRSGHSDDYSWAAYAADLEALLDLVAPGQSYYLAGQCSGGYLGLVLWSRRIRPPAAVTGFEILPPLTPEEEASQFATARRPPHCFAELDRGARSYARALGLPPERGEELAREVFVQDEQGNWRLPADPRTLEIEPFRSFELLAQVDCPVLLIRGTASRQLDRISFLLMAGRLRRGDFAEIPDAGHHAMVEAPDQTCDLLEAFLSSVRAGLI